MYVINVITFARASTRHGVLAVKTLHHLAKISSSLFLEAVSEIIGLLKMSKEARGEQLQ